MTTPVLEAWEELPPLTHVIDFVLLEEDGVFSLATRRQALALHGMVHRLAPMDEEFMRLLTSVIKAVVEHRDRQNTEPLPPSVTQALDDLLEPFGRLMRDWLARQTAERIANVLLDVAADDPGLMAEIQRRIDAGPRPATKAKK